MDYERNEQIKIFSNISDTPTSTLQFRYLVVRRVLAIRAIAACSLAATISGIDPLFSSCSLLVTTNKRFYSDPEI